MHAFAKMTTMALVAAVAVPSGVAFAADASHGTFEQAPAANIPIQAPSNWTGAYVGGAVGGALGNSSADDGVNGKADRTHKGFVGHLYGGYNQQVSPNVVIGGEATLGLNGSTRSFNYAGGTTKTSQNLTASVRARAGYVQGQYMAYGLVGPAYGRGHAEFNGGSAEKDHIGFVVGAGVEDQLSQNIVGRVEYTFTNLGERNYSVGGATQKIGQYDNALTAGVAYKF